jgi:hypothetical protein
MIARKQRHWRKKLSSNRSAWNPQPRTGRVHLIAHGFSRGSAFTSNSALEGAVQDQPDGATPAGLEIARAAPEGLKGRIAPSRAPSVLGTVPTAEAVGY